MTGVIDIHCHILPGIDDGASDMTESLKMLRMAVREGITEFIATPHYSPVFPNADPMRIRRLCRETEETARRRMKNGIRIWPGQEILYGKDTAERLEKGRLLTMAGSRYVLIEFMPAAPFSYIFGAVREMSLNGYRPIIAHAERYGCLREKGRPQELKDQGACIQMNYRRISGKWYSGTARWCREMLRCGIVDLLGTDMHNTSGRSPEIQDALNWMERHLSPSYLAGITSCNQQKILEDKKI